MYMFTPLWTLVGSFLFGLTMKVADLLDEHGLKWFKFSDLLFGLLWGCFGVFMVIAHPILGNLVLATVLAFLVRNRLDYLNHQIAAVIIILGFILFGTFNVTIFLVFFPIYALFGGIKDYLDDKKKQRQGFWYTFFELAPYGVIGAFFYSVITNDWIIFFSWLVAMVGYDGIKYFARTKGYG